MQFLKSQYTRWFNRQYQREGPLFRGRYGSRRIEDDEDLVNVCRYVDRNAHVIVAHGRLEHFGWSGYRATIGLDEGYGWHRTASTWCSITSVPTGCATRHL